MEPPLEFRHVLGPVVPSNLALQSAFGAQLHRLLVGEQAMQDGDSVDAKVAKKQETSYKL